MSSAESLARAVGHLRARRWQNLDTRPHWAGGQLLDAAHAFTTAGHPIVDLTPVVEQWQPGEGFELYNAIVMPVWETVLVGYHLDPTLRNWAVEDDGSRPRPDEFLTRLAAVVTTPDDDEHLAGIVAERTSQNPIEFDLTRVAHVVSVMPWVFSTQTPLGRGPQAIFRVWCTSDGEILDISWAEIEDGAHANCELFLGVVLRALDMLACRNVTITEPHRDRPTRRRIERNTGGARVSELAVFPRGSWTRHDNVRPTPLSALARPLHTVRGHFAEYGVNGKGLLFGRIAGRFFIPAHVRGDADAGTTEQRFTIHDDQEATPA